jgi:hypothetical protein
MARKIPYTSQYVTLTEEQILDCPVDFLKAEFAHITVEILERNERIGNIHWDRLLPRGWTGYAYLIKDGYLLKDPQAVAFKNQIVYSGQAEWKGEIITQTYSSELTTPDLDLNELIDEASVLSMT